MTLDSMIISNEDIYEHEVKFSQEDVNAFVQLSGDDNIIHSDLDAARDSPISSLAIPGMLAALSFSKVLGTLFPGHGTVYRSQSLQFRKPVLLNEPYVVTIRVLKTRIKQHVALVETILRNKHEGAPCIIGQALVLNLKRIR